jgi:hypothetical protein
MIKVTVEHDGYNWVGVPVRRRYVGAQPQSATRARP